MGLDQLVSAVLRYPDASFESRFPLHVDECKTEGALERPCLEKLRYHLLEDGDCNRVICDNIETSTPIEVYANQTDWAPFKNFCGNLKELFLGVFDIGLSMLHRDAEGQDHQAVLDRWQQFSDTTGIWFSMPDIPDAPRYGNSTRSVLEHHVTAVEDLFTEKLIGKQLSAEALLDLASQVARRLQLLIENVSLTLLINFYVAQLEHSGRYEQGRDLVSELYGDVNTIRVIFHEIPGKRWDALGHLLEGLGLSDGRHIHMAEVGVEAANTSQRLIERNPTLSYVGVDPYFNNDALYVDVLQRLTPYMNQGRYVLHRNISVLASKLVEDASMDLVFLDARHDYQAVEEDIAAWRPKVRPGGILSGHDFSWMFPTVAMAVYAAVGAIPVSDRTIHLAPDGVWWFHM